MTPPLTVLIIGGYGTFGGRIVELLEDEPRLTLIVAGRSPARAREFCDRRVAARARLVAAGFDRRGDIAAQLQALRPDVLVDASGPFQAYGAEPYALVEGCIAAGVDYLDLADGSDFVAGIAAYDAAARAAGRYVLSGVSSFPVLTAAVVRRLAGDSVRVAAIRGGIAPSPYAGVGLNVIRAISAYAGQRIQIRRNGRSEAAYPFTEQMRFTIATPGRVPLRRTLFSLVDVPDLRELPALWPEAAIVWMGAGPVPTVLHRALIALARLVRWRLLPSLLPFAGVMHLVTNHLRWGEHRGGMFVAIEGTEPAGTPVRRSWHLTAEGDDGPLIPSMAVAAVIRRVLAGRKPAPGASAAVRELELDDYENLFAGRRIYTGTRDGRETQGRPLYARILGAAWSDLPAEIRAMHDIGGVARAEGRATIDGARSLLGRLVARLIGFPQTAADASVSVQFDRGEDGETWTRRFGGKAFRSRQFAGTGRSQGLLCERFGPLIFAMALVLDGDKLRLVLRRWSAFGVRLPMRLGPYSDSYETVGDGRFRFRVEIGHPLTGLIVRYRGWLVTIGEMKSTGPAG